MAVAHKKMRRLRGGRVLLTACVLGLVYLAVLGVRIHLAGLHDERERADVIIVLGTTQYNGRPSPMLQGRLEHAIDLYQQGYAPYVMFTGGNKPGDLFTEAETGKRYAMEHGVPESAILLEPDGRTTMQSLQACTLLMHRHHLQTAILVSDPFHAFRLRRMAQDLRLHAMVSPTPTSRVKSAEKKTKYTLREVGTYAVYRMFGL
ncbi:MAG: YdcF family protein [Armatimonadota bacterium]